MSLSSSPRLYRDVIEQICGFLGLADLNSVLAVSHEWQAAVGSMRPIAAVERHPHAERLRRIAASRLARHIGVFGEQRAPMTITAAQCSALAQSLTQLTAMHISCDIDPTNAAVLQLPPLLRTLQLWLPSRSGQADALHPNEVASLNFTLRSFAANPPRQLQSLTLVLPDRHPELGVACIEALQIPTLRISYQIHKDGYGRFIVGPKPDPVPPFPCSQRADCTEATRLCEAHRLVLFIKPLNGPVFTIPWPRWECWAWIKERVFEASGVPPEQQRLIFAGAQREDFTRHSGLQYQSTIHLVLRNHAPPAAQPPAAAVGAPAALAPALAPAVPAPRRSCVVQ